jgi:hypothetical protein
MMAARLDHLQVVYLVAKPVVWSDVGREHQMAALMELLTVAKLAAKLAAVKVVWLESC